MRTKQQLFTKILGVVTVILGGIALINLQNAVAQAKGPLTVHPTNPRYFTDDSAKAVYLTGSNIWDNLTDQSGRHNGNLDFAAYLDFLQQNNHNFIRMWNLDVFKSPSGALNQPIPYARTGPGTASDGQPKFDLTQFNPEYLGRLRTRVMAAADRGIYVDIMFFEGWWINGWGASGWDGHPYNPLNNVNGISVTMSQVHTLMIPEIVAFQEAFVRTVIDSVNDLDNVLYEIVNEDGGGSVAWQEHFISFIKDYEATKPKQHPVGMIYRWPNGTNSELFASSADWISPDDTSSEPYASNPPAGDGAKVIISDTDHLCPDGGCSFGWVWRSFTRGLNPIYLDIAYANQTPPSSEAQKIRRDMGQTLTFANRINLAAMVPRGDLASSTYCLANAVASAAEYLVYVPSGGSVTVDLSASPVSLAVEWFNPDSGATIDGGQTAGGVSQDFTAPFSGDAVLYLYDANPTLPVELVNFSALAAGNDVTLSWQTASETNNLGFEIQRRRDATDFKKIGFVAGNHTTTALQSYSYIDGELAVGRYYYRLKQIDADGSFDFSPVVEVTVSIPTQFELKQNYPNPFNPATTIVYSLPRSDSVKLVILNIRGEEVATLVSEFQTAGEYSITFDASALAAGLYFYKLQIGGPATGSPKGSGPAGQVFVETKKMLFLK